jgi:hypothetical protein
MVDNALGVQSRILERFLESRRQKRKARITVHQLPPVTSIIVSTSTFSMSIRDAHCLLPLRRVAYASNDLI